MPMQAHRGGGDTAIWMPISLLYPRVNTHVEVCGRELRQSACYKTNISGCVNSEVDYFIDTNLMHNFSYKLHTIKFLYMFRASSAHLQEVNPLNPELNPICYLLALLGAHHFLHVSRIRVKLLTFRLLMSYIYGAPILDVSRSHTTTQHSR